MSRFGKTSHLILMLLALAALVLGAGSCTRQPKKGDKKPVAVKRQSKRTSSDSISERTWQHVTPESVERELRAIYALGPRAVGQSGHRKIHDYIKAELTKLRLEPLAQEFYVTAPIDTSADGTDGNAHFHVGGKSLRLWAVWPNACAASYAGEELVSGEKRPLIRGPLVDGGDGSLAALDGRPVKGALVLLNFNSGKNWENAARLGARAIVFRFPVNSTSSQEAGRKFFMVPLEVPRFMLDAEQTRELDTLLAGRPFLAEPCSIVGGARWEKVRASNILAYIEGKDPGRRQDVLVLQAYMDSMCVAPGMPHGADTSLQLVAALNIARSFVSAPPECSVLLVFTDAHHYTLAGARELGHVFGVWARHKELALGGEDQPLSLAALARAARNRTVDLAAAVKYLEAPGSPSALNEDAQKIIAERINQVVLRLKMLVATEIQVTKDTKGATPAGPTLQERTALLRQLRDWLIGTEFTKDPVRKIERMLAGPTVDGKNPAAASYRARGLFMDRQMVARELSELLDDFEREARRAESDLMVAQRIFRGHEVGRFVGLYLELAPGADQLTWSNSTALGFRGEGNLRAMHTVQAPQAEKLAARMGLRNFEPLGEAFSLEGTNARGNRAAPGVAETCVMAGAGFPAFGLRSMNADRTLIDTPVDAPDTIDYQKAGDVVRFLSGFVPYLATDLDGLMPGGQSQFMRVIEVGGRVVRYDILAGTKPNQPVPGSLAYYPLGWLGGESSAGEGGRTGVRWAAVEKVGQLGRFRFRGIADRSSVTAPATPIFGFHFDPQGRIDWALDSGSQGTATVANTALRAGNEDVAVAIAKLRSVAFYDLMDPRTLVPLTELNLMAAKSLNKLDQWSFFLPKDQYGAASYLENCAVAFMPERASFVGLIQRGLDGVRATYLNLAPDEGAGKKNILQYQRRGFPVASTRQVVFPTLQVARDMTRVNAERLAMFGRWGIHNKMLDELHAESTRALARAEEAYAAQKYALAYKEAEHAWGVAVRAYEPVRGMGKSAVIGSVFFMALVLPFAFFMERLTIRAKTPNWRVVATLLWFLAIFSLLFVLHPAFSISLSPMVVLLAFVMLVLVAVVSSIIYRKFVNLVRTYRNQLEGVHGADIKRFSAGGVALNLSLSTMARRKARTLLTGATLTMLAFAIVTFSSLTSAIQYQKTPLSGVTPPYTGVMFRMPDWLNMPASVVDSFRNEFGDSSAVMPRTWKTRAQHAWEAGQAGRRTMLVKRFLTPQTNPTTVPAKPREIFAPIEGIVGLTPEEATVLPLQGPPGKSFLRVGRWLAAGKDNEALIAPDTARQLRISDQDVLRGRAEIVFGEDRFAVVGIVNPDIADKYADLDGESFVPVDLVIAGVDLRGRGVDLTNLPTMDVSQRMPHLSYSKLMIVSYARTLRMSDTVHKAVAVKFGPNVDPDAALHRLTRRLKIPVFAGFVEKDPARSQSVLMQAVDTPGFKGISRLIVPIALAVFMIVNTLLGTVEERKDEIAMLNSVGLAPAHVGMLFLVEAVVYGVIGLVVGYLGGLCLAKLLLGNNALLTALGASGLSLNYSSGATIVSCVLVLVIVVLSAAYPARQAKRMATPGTLARWVLPESDDGSISIEVPFTLTGGNAIGMIGFLDEYLAQHREATSPDFRVMHRALREVPDSHEGQPELSLEGEAYLAPYDLGVSNSFRVLLRATTQPNIFRVRFAIARLGGDMNSYRRATQRFLDLLRRQFLIWRTLEPNDKQKYVTRALEGFARGLSDGVRISADLSPATVSTGSA